MPESSDAPIRRGIFTIYPDGRMFPPISGGMGDDAGQSQDGSEGGTTSTATDEFRPIESQADLDAVIRDRLSRERQKYADYKDLKAKAAKLDELEAANQSELERASSKATAAEAERDDARAEALRLRVAVEHGIGVEDADLFLTGRDEDTLRAQAKRLTDREADRKKQGNKVTREGTNTTAAQTDERAFVRDLFGSGG